MANHPDPDNADRHHGHKAENMSQSLGRAGSALEGIFAAIMAMLGLSQESKSPLKVPEIEQAVLAAKQRGPGVIYVAQGKVGPHPALMVLYEPPGEKAQIVDQIELDGLSLGGTSIKDWPETGSPQAQVWRVEG